MVGFSGEWLHWVNVVVSIQVMEGGGRMVVTAVGPNSQQGLIFALLTERDEDVGECVSV